MRINHTLFTIIGLLAFLVGIALFEYFQARVIVPNHTALLLSGLLISCLVLRRKFPEKSFLLNIVLWTVICSLGFLRAQTYQHFPTPESVDYYASEEGEFIQFIGTISAEPDIRRDKVNYTVSVEAFTNEDGTFTEASGKTLLSAGKYPPYQYGERIFVKGSLQKPTSFEGFDYAQYLARFNIHSVMYRPGISRNIPDEFSPKPPSLNKIIIHKFWTVLLSIKQQFESHMNKTFSSEPSSSFMAGLLLGSRKGIPDELSEAFRITGLTHIIAISGYNITLIVSILMAFFKPFGRRNAIILSAVGIILFTLFVGASPAVVRACIMGLISLLALSSKRKGDITLTLLMTACIMIGWNPKILFYDVGFQLSFLATMGLIYVSPLLEPYFLWLPQKLAIRESILLTLSAQITALPIILMNFQNLSVVSPLSNMLISGPILPLAMLFGFIGTMMSFIWLSAAKIIAAPAYLLLAYVTNITWLTAQLPYAMVEVPWFDQKLLLAYFSLLSMYLFKVWKQRALRQQIFQQLINGFEQRYANILYASH